MHEATIHARMEKDEAKEEFRRLVSLYGIQWRAGVPASAWDILARINQVLTASDRREAILSHR